MMLSLDRIDCTCAFSWSGVSLPSRPLPFGNAGRYLDVAQVLERVVTVLWSLEAAPVPLEGQLDVDRYPGREPFWSVVSCELFEAMGEVRSWLSTAVGDIHPEGWPIHLELLTCPENCAAGFASHNVIAIKRYCPPRPLRPWIVESVNVNE